MLRKLLLGTAAALALATSAQAQNIMQPGFAQNADGCTYSPALGTEQIPGAMLRLFEYRSRLSGGNDHSLFWAYLQPSAAWSLTSSISGTTLTTASATGVATGQLVVGTGVAANTFITGGSGTTWTVSVSQTVGSESMSGVPAPVWTTLDDAITCTASYNMPLDIVTIGTPTAWTSSTNANIVSQYTSFFTQEMAELQADKANVGYLENWNEVDTDSDSNGWTGTPQTMAQMMAAAYPISKTYFPNAIVFGASMGSANTVTNAYMAACAASGPCQDAFAGHPYPTLVTSVGASFTGAISGTTLTVSSVTGTIAAGQTVQGFGVAANTLVVSGSGTSWVVSVSQTVSSTAMSSNAAPPDIVNAPELTVNNVEAFKGMMTDNGFGSQAVYCDEWWAGSSQGNFSADTSPIAGAVARMLLLHASAGCKSSDYYIYDVANGQNQPTLYGPSFGGLNWTGRAYKTVAGWLWGSSVGVITRTQGTNALHFALNGSGVVVGKISGPASPPTGCPVGTPTGSGSLPTGMAASNPASANGMGLYLVADGASDPQTGTPYEDLLFCGTDTTSGSGSQFPSLFFDNTVAAAGSTTPASQQQWIMTLAVGQTPDASRLPGSSMANLSAAGVPILNELASSGGFSGLNPGSNHWNVPWPASATSLSLENQTYEFRIKTVNASTAALAAAMQWSYSHNSASPVPINLELRISNLSLQRVDNATTAAQYGGVITGVDGVQRCVAWNSSGLGSTYTVPSPCASYAYYEDDQGVTHLIASPGTVPLPTDGSPILIEPAPRPKLSL